ncbi:MAG: DNA-binding response regulator [Candidatus Nephthysia bennettiae]|uniref:Response regulator transcription factor n=1 Tax=Candidatus Nephthysia bennettiae TaxID=3127016 RepID=A0A934K548_9BACT|nr:response regulator transcription factor [Candidatus Dormibacteraeota bacterium]MBJ7611549.1 response regulator transcription factor [Candidatus Dormibacteraeota bacterium]PZS00272.1 MAG: DNA-binding response regulator [Candidatus Dormibacteraeota bacterium]
MRVLIVEDDHRLAASVRRGLEGEGFATDTVHDGEEALAAAQTTPYDVILLDLMLPRVDGIEVSRRLRQRRVQVPILMLTARDSVDDRVLGLESGADDYLVKPFALREVVARIRALSRRHLADRTAVLTAGPVALDTGGRTLRVGERQVEVTPKEYAILEYFMLNQGRLLTRDQIIEHVWDYDFEGGRNLIETYINRLRSKITRAGAPDPFVTVRGSGGYRFDHRPRAE